MKHLEEFTDWFSAHQLPCVWKHYFDIDCPFCGFQRAVIALLQGDIWESITLFPALIPLTITGLIFLIYCVFSLPKLKTTLYILMIADLIILLGHCVLKNIIHFCC